MPASTATPALRPAIKRTARIAAVCGWSYIITIFAVFGTSSVPPGALRVMLLNVSILFTIIGIFELFWRHKLLKSGLSRFARMLALNEVFGTLALIWNLILLYSVPDTLLVPYFKSNISPETWKMLNGMSLATGAPINDATIAQSIHLAKALTTYGVGGILFLFQIWVILRYLRLAGKIESESSLPPILK